VRTRCSTCVGSAAASAGAAISAIIASRRRMALTSRSWQPCGGGVGQKTPRTGRANGAEREILMPASAGRAAAASVE
jgi:hypothetical protein